MFQGRQGIDCETYPESLLCRPSFEIEVSLHGGTARLRESNFDGQKVPRWFYSRVN